MHTKRLLSAILAMLLVLTLTACGSKSAASDYVSNSFSSAEAAPMAPNGEVLYESGSGMTGDAASVPDVNRKLIKTVYLDAETRDMDTLLSQLDDQVAAMGGYMEERNVRNGSSYSGSDYRYANLTVRIPAAQLDAFVSKVEGLSNITSSNQSVEDITLQYVAVQSRVTALETEQTRLLELMEQAATMSDLLEIEARLTDVRYELESVASQMRVYDNQVDYATIHLAISQVRELTPPEPEGFFQRIGSGFVENLKDVGNGLVDLFVWLIVGIPYWVVLALVITAVILIVKKLPKRPRRNKKQKDGQDQAG